MKLNNALVRGQLRSIQIENGRIEAIGDTPFAGGIDLRGKTVIPGLIDIHTHGCRNADTMDADFAVLCREYAKMGTTAFLPTTMTADAASIQAVLRAKTEFRGAKILGFHLEGPFLSKQYKGAHDERFLTPPSAELFAEFDNIAMITVAPEVAGGIEFVRQVAGKTIVSLGHTACDYDTAADAIAAGARCLTHMYNAMPPMLHRAPGPIGAAADAGIYAQIICDPVHVSPTAFRFAYKVFGAERLVLISDSIRCAGMHDGEYICGGLPVTLQNKKATLADGTIAGSCLSLLDCVKNACRCGVPFADAVKMATETPAALLGVQKGKVEVGYDADLLILDADLNIDTVILGGEVWE